MINKPKSKKPAEFEETRKRDATSLARLIYKMWKEEKAKK
jgi:hypothetical protein